MRLDLIDEFRWTYTPFGAVRALPSLGKAIRFCQLAGAAGPTQLKAHSRVLPSRERRSGRAPRTSAGRRLGTLPVPGAPTGRGERRASAKPSFACGVPSRGFKPRAQPFGQGRVEHFGGSREHDEVPGVANEDR